MADDAAPIVFALSCLTAILVPWTLLKLRRLLRKSVAEADAWLALGFAPTSAVVAKARASAPKTPWLSNILWVAAVACEVALLQNLPANESGMFDPYEVLGLERARPRWPRSSRRTAASRSSCTRTRTRAPRRRRNSCW